MAGDGDNKRIKLSLTIPDHLAPLPQVSFHYNLENSGNNPNNHSDPGDDGDNSGGGGDGGGGNGGGGDGGPPPPPPTSDTPTPPSTSSDSSPAGPRQVLRRVILGRRPDHDDQIVNLDSSVLISFFFLIKFVNLELPSDFLDSFLISSLIFS